MIITKKMFKEIIMQDMHLKPTWISKILIFHVIIKINIFEGLFDYYQKNEAYYYQKNEA